MTNIISLTLLVLLISIPGIAAGQDLQIEPRDQPQGVITKVPFEGRYYFIKIVPVDTTASIPMPVYNPETRWMYAAAESLRYLIPDSLMQLLPEMKPDSLRLPETEKQIK